MQTINAHATKDIMITPLLSVRLVVIVAKHAQVQPPTVHSVIQARVESFKLEQILVIVIVVFMTMAFLYVPLAILNVLHVQLHQPTVLRVILASNAI